MDHLKVAAQAINSLGGASSVARLRGRSPWAISKWMRNGIPAGEVLWVAEQTEWEFTPHQLAPSLYPHPLDGLPDDRRAAIRGKSTQEAA